MKYGDMDNSESSLSRISIAFCEMLMGHLVANNDNDDNIAVSPSRLQAVLLMLANWAAPDMQQKILNVACCGRIGIEDANKLFDKKKFSIAACCGLNGKVDENNPVIELNTILWLQEQLRLKPGHIADMKDVFGLEYERVDFTDPDTQNVINSKINEASHGLIPGLGIDIDPKTLALLTDIMYFKAQWETPFKEIDTDELPFYGAKETVEVPTMCMEERLPYRETDSYEMVELTYQCESYPEKSYMMRVFLPKRCVPINELLKAIAADDGKQSSIEHVCLYLPRFSVESNIIMTDVLRQIGLEDIFKSTDISPLLADHLQIADIAQRVKIIVNEKETEAAALTSVLDVGCAPLDDYVDDEPIVMTVDRPFLFEIVEKSNEMVLFTGVINDIE